LKGSKKGKKGKKDKKAFLPLFALLAFFASPTDLQKTNLQRDYGAPYQDRIRASERGQYFRPGLCIRKKLWAILRPPRLAATIEFITNTITQTDRDRFSRTLTSRGGTVYV
jgi:hypothetical protein